MPRMRNMDGSSGYADAQRWIAPPSLPVREPTQVLDRREDRPWPFLYSYQKDGSVSVNRGAKKTTYQQATEVGEAIM